MESNTAHDALAALLSAATGQTYTVETLRADMQGEEGETFVEVQVPRSCGDEELDDTLAEIERLGFRVDTWTHNNALARDEHFVTVYFPVAETTAETTEPADEDAQMLTDLMAFEVLVDRWSGSPADFEAARAWASQAGEKYEDTLRDLQTRFEDAAAMALAEGDLGDAAMWAQNADSVKAELKE